jgi:hypothetical protein
MEDGVFDRIRRRCRDVAGQAQRVRIVESAIAGYAGDLASLPLRTPAYDDVLHFRGRPDDTVTYVVTLDAVNFGSGYFPYLVKRPGHSGYGTIAQSLTERFRAEGPLTSSEMAAFTPAGCARLFGQDLSTPPIADLMALFAQAWNDLGRDLHDRFGGSFTALVEEADASASRLVSLLDQQPLFHDVSIYRGDEVPFYKRAQILVSDLALAFGDRGFGRFEDLNALTIFADNLVPHVLRLDGILAYAPDLIERIARGELLPAGSESEVEIRACALHAVELIVESLRAKGRDVTAREVDIALWNRGQSPRYKEAPRHRTRTTSY